MEDRSFSLLEGSKQPVSLWSQVCYPPALEPVLWMGQQWGERQKELSQGGQGLCKRPIMQYSWLRVSGINFPGFSHSHPCLELFFFLVNCLYVCHRPCVSAPAPCSRTQDPRHLSKCPPDSDLCLQHGNRSVVPATGGDGRREMHL